MTSESCKILVKKFSFVVSMTFLTPSGTESLKLNYCNSTSSGHDPNIKCGFYTSGFKSLRKVLTNS